tara:strand:+ start:694 stop:927 length:234 start_codon:yes stop_codon:yes gene_type:complete
MPKKTAANIAQERVGIRLSSHEKLCAERMLNLQKSIERLERKVENLTDSVSKGKGIVAVLVFFGSIGAAIIGYLNFK